MGLPCTSLACISFVNTVAVSILSHLSREFGTTLGTRSFYLIYNNTLDKKKGTSAPFFERRPLLRWRAILDFDEFLVAADNFLHDLIASFEHRIRDAARIEPDRAAGIVVARNHVIDTFRIVVGVDHRDDWNTQLLRFGDGAFVIAHVDHEQRIRQAVH